MITKLTLRNFRAFKNQSFEFTKINIFVGPNNSGKSSALSALNLLAQTFHASDFSETALQINGQFDQLGTYQDIVFKNRSNTPVGFDIGYSDFEIKIDFKFRAQRREIEVSRYEILYRKKVIYFYQLRKDGFDLKVNNRNIEDFHLGSKKRKPKFVGLFPDRPSYEAFYLFKREKTEGDVPGLDQWRTFERIMFQARRDLRRSIFNYDSLSPFREKPERTYLYSGETASKIGVTGENLAILLANDSSRRGSESKEILQQVSRWFKATGIAEAIEINSIGSRHFELVLVEKDGGKHNISDVGFGCSQVLPVLAATINSFQQRIQPGHDCIFVVQEPEIHLHPNAQAALGSFFAGIVPEFGQLFVETHSDNLIIRLARHVAEGIISPDDLKIFYVSKVDGSSEVTSLAISRDGTFGLDWPGGFFPQRQSESLALARESRRSSELQREQQLTFVYPEER